MSGIEFIDTSKDLTDIDSTKLALVLDQTISLWEHLAKTGSNTKSSWVGWESLKPMLADCPLCDYTIRRTTGKPYPEGTTSSNFKMEDRNCAKYCPIARKSGLDIACLHASGSPYRSWESANTSSRRTYYAHQFLEELKGYRAALVKPKEEWVDITDQCNPFLVKSHSSDGYYIALRYVASGECYHPKASRVAVFGTGPSGKTYQATSNRFKVVKAEGARISFRVYKRMSHDKN